MDTPVLGRHGGAERSRGDGSARGEVPRAGSSLKAKYYSHTSHIAGRMTNSAIIDNSQNRDDIGHTAHCCASAHFRSSLSVTVRL